MNDELITNEKDEVEIDKNTEKSDDLITEIQEDGKVKPILTEEQIKSKKKKRRKVAVGCRCSRKLVLSKHRFIKYN